MMREFKRVEVMSRADLRRWLADNHRQPESVWLVTYKKACGTPPHCPYADVVEEALCFGWIDSLARRLDGRRSMLLLSPRRPGSAWSRPNKGRAERLIESGLMTPAGLEKIERAKADGTWSALDEVEALVIPDDLAAALKQNPAAAQHFDAFPRSAKRGILEWIGAARRPATREARVARTVELAAQNVRANYKPRKP